MKKTLNTTGVMNELRGQSVFFPAKQAEEPDRQEPFSLPSNQSDTVIPRYHEPMIPSIHDTTIPEHEEDAIEVVRKAVKQIGKEGATQRLTLEEKQALAEIEYRYKRQGIKTSGNEIIRIALNYAIDDYQKHGEQSVLAKVLKRLNS